MDVPILIWDGLFLFPAFSGQGLSVKLVKSPYWPVTMSDTLNILVPVPEPHGNADQTWRRIFFAGICLVQEKPYVL